MYLHQLSGGMRQRIIVVAMATFFEPEIILADAPTTALDVVVQKGILLLLMNLQGKMKNTILFVSHDMGVNFQITHNSLSVGERIVPHARTEIGRVPRGALGSVPLRRDA